LRQLRGLAVHPHLADREDVIKRSAITCDGAVQDLSDVVTLDHVMRDTRCFSCGP
jgi:hypothetical protein